MSSQGWGRSNISHVKYGKLRPNDTIQYCQQPPSELTKCLIRRVSILASALILHPLGMAATDTVLTGERACHQEVRDVLERWVLQKRIEVVIDVTCTAPGLFGYTEPFRGANNKAHLKHTVFFSKWHADRLVDAWKIDGRTGGPCWSRHLYMMAQGLAHELIHLNRWGISMRLRKRGLGHLVPLETPETIKMECRNESKPEAGWYFERELGGGGLLEGVWFNTPEAVAENAVILGGETFIDTDSENGSGGSNPEDVNDTPSEKSFEIVFGVASTQTSSPIAPLSRTTDNPPPEPSQFQSFARQLFRSLGDEGEDSEPDEQSVGEATSDDDLAFFLQEDRVSKLDQRRPYDRLVLAFHEPGETKRYFVPDSSFQAAISGKSKDLQSLVLSIRELMYSSIP